MNNFRGKYGPILIAEIGGNHEGNFEYAKKLTKQAIESDVDFIKFQLYTGDTLVNPIENPNRNKHFKKFELTNEQHIYLAEMIQEAGINYMASVWNTEYIKFIDEYMPIYKIGSGDLTAFPILKTIALIGKPIILSTGLSSEQDVLRTVEFIQNVNSKYQSDDFLAVLQCTSMYPIENSDANLNVIKKLKELTGLTVGYSDHTIGYVALKYAVAAGAEILEFHFTDTREGKEFRDHKVSLIPEEIKKLQQEIIQINKIMGDSEKKALDIEIKNGHDISFRRAVYPAVEIKKGTVIEENHLKVLRPNHGLDAREYYNLIGKIAKTDMKINQKLSWNFFE